MPPPEGQKSNFENPETRDTELIVMNAVFLSCTVVAVAVRFIARRSSKDVVGWDGCKLQNGYLIISSLILDSVLYSCDARFGGSQWTYDFG